MNDMSFKESKKNNFSHEDKKEYETWLRLMKIGEKTGCHQRADRSFYYHGMQFPVCARCTGVFIAYISSILCYICYILFQCIFRRKKGNRQSNTGNIFALFGCMLMFFDWLMQALHIKESTNVRRLITGFVGGLGIMHFYRIILRVIYKKGKELFGFE